MRTGQLFLANQTLDTSGFCWNIWSSKGQKVKGMSAPGEKSETQVVRGEITESERRSSIFTVFCESVGTWHVQTYNKTLESSEDSCAVSEDAQTAASTIPSSATDKLDRHLRRF